MEKIVCGGAMFYARCSSNVRVKKVLQKFQFNPSVNNAKELLENKEVELYCDGIADECPLECPLFEVSMRKRAALLRNAEKKAGGLCPAALFEKAVLLSLGWWGA